MKPRSFARTLAMALATALLVVGSAVAPAAALSGTQYDGTNPATTGCATGSTVIYSATLKIHGNGATVGTMEVRYSPTCKTNWVRVYSSVSLSDLRVIKFIERPAGTYPYFSQTETDYVSGWSYGMQVYAPGSTCIKAQGGLSTSAWTAWSPYVTLC